MSSFEKNLFYLILLLLPVNLAKHFFFDFAYVDGVLVDYLIPTVYLTDILIGALLLLWLFMFLRGRQYSSIYCCTIREGGPLVVFGFGIIVVSGLSISNALNQPAAVYKWLKLLEYILFSSYIANHIDLKKDWPTIVKLLSVGVLFEAFLAVAQWLNQGSIFGYWFFGENKYTISTPGIATFDFDGIKKVRPYGTFPHPNVLGGYLAILLPWILYQWRGRRKFYSLTLLGGLSGLYLTFSRSAWLAGALGLLATGGLILKQPFILLTSISFIRRAELNWIALHIVRDHPLLGVGLNNFTVRMDEYGRVSGWVRFLQPVHNLYLLIAAEIGLVGLVLFLCFMFSAFSLLLKSRDFLLLISLTQIFLLGLSDHYFWTIQQTSILFWLIVGLVFSYRFKYNQSRK